MKIVNLKDYPEYIEEVSYYLYKQWQEPNDWLSLEDTIKRTKNIFKAKKWIPTMLIALEDNIFVWTVSLWISDISERQDLFPFLASLFVKEEYRNQWVWRKLVQVIEQVAKQNGWDKLYLYDDSNIENLYVNYWYIFFEEETYKWYTYKIYFKKL